jgi:uncharacterized protein DUF4410
MQDKLAVMVAVVALAGCAVTPSVEQQQPISADLSKYRVLYARVDAPEVVRKQFGYDKVAPELMRQFVAEVRSSGGFASVTTEPPAGQALEARLDITQLVYVNETDRVLTGVLAGRAVLAATMTLVDKETSTVIGRVSAADTSSHMHGIFGAGSSRQSAAIAKEFSSRLAR